MVMLDEKSARLVLFVVRDFSRRVDRKTRDVLRLRFFENVLPGLVGEPIDQRRLHRIVIGGAGSEAFEELALRPFRIAHRGLGAAPESIRDRTETYPSILARIHPRQAEFRAGSNPHPIRSSRSLVAMNSHCETQHADHRKPHARIDTLSLAGS